MSNAPDDFCKYIRSLEDRIAMLEKTSGETVPKIAFGAQPGATGDPIHIGWKPTEVLVVTFQGTGGDHFKVLPTTSTADGFVITGTPNSPGAYIWIAKG